MRHLTRPLAACVAVTAGLLAARPASADMGVGTRAIGMGGAYTAVAQGAQGAYWNPAGVARQARLDVDILSFQGRIDGPGDLSDLTSNPPTDADKAVDLAKKFSTGVTEVEVTGLVGAAGRHFALGVLGFANGAVTPRDIDGNIGIKFHTDPDTGKEIPDNGSNATFVGGAAYSIMGTYGATYTGVPGEAATPPVDWGVNVKLARGRGVTATARWNGVDEDADTHSDVGSWESKLGADLGLLYDVREDVTVGAIWRNVIQPKVPGMDSDSRLSVGAAWKPLGTNTLVAADIADIGSKTKLNIGAEWRPVKSFAVRGGLRNGKAVVGLGLGGFLSVAYQLDSNMISVGGGF